MPTFPEKLSHAQIGYRFRARRDAEAPMQDWIIAKIVRPQKHRVTIRSGWDIPVSSPGGVYAFPIEPREGGGIINTKLVFFTEGGE